MMELASMSLRPWSLLVLTYGVAKLGSHSACNCTSDDPTAIDVETLGLMGVSARSLRLTATPLARWSYSRTLLFLWTARACVDTHRWAGQNVSEQVDLQLPRRPKALELSQTRKYACSKTQSAKMDSTAIRAAVL